MEKLSLSRRARIGLLSILLSFLLVYLFLLPRNPGAYRAVPGYAALLLEFNGALDASRLTGSLSDQPWKDVLNTPVFRQCWADVNTLENIVHHDQDVRKALAFNKLLAAFSLHPADSLHPVLILDVRKEIPLEQLLHAHPEHLRFFPYSFHGHTLFTVHLSETASFVLAEKNGLLFGSAFSYLVEDALSQTEKTGGWWAQNKNIGDLAPKAPLRIFLRPDKWRGQQTAEITPALLPDIGRLAGNLSWIGWAWDGRKVSVAGESSGFMSDIRYWNGASPARVGTILPDNTSLLFWSGFDRRNLFFEKFNNGRSFSDFEHFTLPWIDNEMATGFLEPVSPALRENSFLLFSTFDGQKAQEMLRNFGESRGMIMHDRTGIFEIFGFQSNSFIAPFLSGGETEFQTPFCAVAGEYVVVAPNRHVLENVLEKYIANQTLAQQPDFLRLAETFQKTDRALFLMNGAYLPKLLQALLPNPGVSAKASAKALGATGWISLEINPGYGQSLKIQGGHAMLSAPPPQSDVYWETPLLGPVAGPVSLVAQPGMDKKWRLLVQDQASQLYCMKPDGTVEWQRRTGAPLLSQPIAADYFKSGRNAYVFNTPQDLWLLDEYGKDVDGFPVHLKANAVSGLTAVDFDRNKEYCYFINSENNNVYGFDFHGKSLSGWNPLKTGSKSVCPLVHFQFDGKDYLVRLSVDGQLNVYDRSGNPRFPAVQLQGTFTETPVIDFVSGEVRILCLSTSGDIYACSSNGTLTPVVKSGFAGKKPLKWVICNTGEASVIALTAGKHLGLFKWNAGHLSRYFTGTLPFECDHLSNNGNFLGIVNTRRHSLALLDLKGRVQEGFPLAGDTLFVVIPGNNQQLLVSGNRSAVCAYVIH